MSMKKQRKRVAVFPAGSEIGLEIQKALKYSTFFEVVGFSSAPCHGRYVYQEYYEGIPFYTNPDFISVLNQWLQDYQIDFLYPAYDDVQLFLTQHQRELCCSVVTSDANTVAVCRSKKRTYEYLKEQHFIPNTYATAEEIDQYPVFVKPDIGQGSQGACLIHSAQELNLVCNNGKEMVICEYLPGEEFTVDCFTDKDGTLLSCSFRKRKRIRNGISVSSEVLELPVEIQNMAQLINCKFRFCGAWFFQVKQNANQQYKLLEIAPRIAGTMGLTRNLGINYPMLTLFTMMEIPVLVRPNQYSLEVDRALCSCYHAGIAYDRVYVDLDDTLIIRGKVNTMLVLFLYQCVNNGKERILLTRHAGDVRETLKQHRISETLFDQIIHIGLVKKKSDYISGNAILIDDSFRERNDVSVCCKIPVFDCSEIETLIDWRAE